QLRTLKVQILNFGRQIMAWHRSNEASRRLDEIPGIGPALATALVASVADPKAFRSGRNFSAWIGLVPKQHSSGGKDKLGSISKQGDRYLRSIWFDPAQLSSHCDFPSPPERGAVNPDAMHDHGQPTRQRHDRLLPPAMPGDLHRPGLEPG